VSVFLIYPPGSEQLVLRHRSFGCGGDLSALPAVPAGGFHNWTLNPFHMMGVAGDSGRLRLACVPIHRRHVMENTLF